jgi:hypothetical protein
MDESRTHTISIPLEIKRRAFRWRSGVLGEEPAKYQEQCSNMLKKKDGSLALVCVIFIADLMADA